MSERDLVKELKATIADLTVDKDEALAKVKSKEARLKQVMIKLEHATQDVQSVGHKIEEQNKEISKLKAKLETKERLLQDALKKIKGIYEDSTEKEEVEEQTSEDEE
jgi:tRNA/tmRNA/rRNA uracil-C5-methylase (TrmA/RlmC/RlmD family)|tara:strand:+ start:2268 stop:2588 length:321 start_codon:yes stop_codon:yes gene_type:complete